MNIINRTGGQWGGAAEKHRSWCSMLIMMVKNMYLNKQPYNDSKLVSNSTTSPLFTQHFL